MEITLTMKQVKQFIQKYYQEIENKQVKAQIRNYKGYERYVGYGMGEHEEKKVHCNGVKLYLSRQLENSFNRTRARNGENL